MKTIPLGFVSTHLIDASIENSPRALRFMYRNASLEAVTVRCNLQHLKTSMKDVSAAGGGLVV